jgi:hypothetical protein
MDDPLYHCLISDMVQDIFLPQNFQTSSGAQLASYSKGTRRPYPEGKKARA